MNEHSSEHGAQEFEASEHEVQLMDLVEVIWKWKYLILIGALLCTAIGVFASFQMTEVYRVSTVIEPGVVHLDRYGRVVRTCKGQELKDLIETGAMNVGVLNELKQEEGADPPKTLDFDVEHPRNSDILKVSYETPDPEIGLRVLKELNKALLKNFEGLVNRWKDQYSTELTTMKGKGSELVQRIVRRKNGISSARVENAIKISQIETKIGSAETRIAKLGTDKKTHMAQKANDVLILRARIDTQKKQIKNLNERITDVKHELARITENTDRLIEERDRFLSSASEDKRENSFGSVMYITTVQQNIAYINNLRSSINDLNKQIFQESLAIQELETQIKDIDLEKNKLEESTAYQIKDLKMDISDYRNEMQSLNKGLELEIGNVESEITALEVERDSVNEEIKQLESKRSDVENIQIRKPPTAGIEPVKPYKTLIALSSLAVGFSLSVLLAFFLDALAKRRSGKDQ